MAIYVRKLPLGSSQLGRWAHINQVGKILDDDKQVNANKSCHFSSGKEDRSSAVIGQERQSAAARGYCRT